MPKRHLSSPLEYRILLVGDRGVGKTSLIARYVRNEFPFNKNSTVNSDGSTIYQTVIDGDDCALIFFDISSINDIDRLKLLDKLPTACFIMFSITDERSFLKLNSYQDTIRSKFLNNQIPVPIFFLSNKIDLEYERAVNQQSIDRFKSVGFNVFDISIKGNVGIDDAIYTAIKHLQYEQHHLKEKLKPNNACTCVIT